MGKHKNRTQIRMFVVKLTTLYVTPGIESILWKKKIFC